MRHFLPYYIYVNTIVSSFSFSFFSTNIPFFFFWLGVDSYLFTFYLFLAGVDIHQRRKGDFLFQVEFLEMLKNKRTKTCFSDFYLALGKDVVSRSSKVLVCIKGRW